MNYFFFSSRRRHTRSLCDWSSDVCSSDLNVWIRAWLKGRVLHCAIRDYGAGFDAQAAQAATGRKGLGLIAMRERLSAIGGTLWIESSQRSGTELSIRLPMEDDHVN